MNTLVVPILASVALLLASANLLWFAQPLLPDSAGFLNPILEFVWTGDVIYPAHGPDHARTMVVHPPVYSVLIGTLVSAGLEPLQAIGLLLVCLYVVVVAGALHARIPEGVKLAVIYAVYVAVFVLSRVDGFRPEAAVTLAWVAALTWLLAAESRQFPAATVAFGAMLLAFASSLHYVAWPAVAGAAAFLVSAWLRARSVFGRVLWSVTLGIGVYAIPYVIGFVWPERNGIAAILGGTSSVVPFSPAGVRQALQVHMAIYADPSTWAANAGGPVAVFQSIVHAIDFLGCAGLAAAYLFVGFHRSTRTLGLAALALTLPILLLVGRKWSFYLKPEFFVLSLSVLLVADWVGRRLPGVQTQYGQLACWMAIAALCVFDTRIIAASRGTVALDEIAVQRAFGREVAGPDATIGGRSILAWFTSGASLYRFVTNDLIYPPDISHVDPTDYFRHFDAVAEDPQGSWLTYNRQQMSLTSFYVARHVRLAGVYSPRFPVEYGGLVWFAPRVVQPVRAVYYQDGNPQEFVENEQGATVLATVGLESFDAPTLAHCGRELIRLRLPRAAQVHMLLADSGLTGCVAKCRSCTVIDTFRGGIRPFAVRRYEDAVNYRTDRVRIFYGVQSGEPH